MAFPQAVQFQGRWDMHDTSYFATWCGSSIRFRTASRSIRVELGDLSTTRAEHPNVLWNFDFGGGGAFSLPETHTKHANGPHSLVLEPSFSATDADGDDGPPPCDVTIMLCDWGAALDISNIYTMDGHPILSPSSRSPLRPILFIGDSLVSGFSPPHTNVMSHGAFQSMANVAIRTLRTRGLDARLEMVAYPGIRLITTTSRGQGMEHAFWDGKDGLGAWDTRSRDSPEDIFVCIGTNDQGWGEVKDTFLERYKAFLIRLRDCYKESCKRMFVISPFGVFKFDHISHRLTIFEPDVQHMVEALAQSWADADPSGVILRHVSTQGWIDKSLTCDTLHPTAQGHQIIGAKLVDYMESLGLV